MGFDLIDLAHEDEPQAVVNEVMNPQCPYSLGEILDLLRYYKLFKKDSAPEDLVVCLLSLVVVVVVFVFVITIVVVVVGDVVPVFRVTVQTVQESTIRV